MYLNPTIELETKTAAPCRFTWPARVLIVAAAVCGSIVYVASYRLIDSLAAWTSLAALAGVAAATAWIGFGSLLLMTAQMRTRELGGVSILDWIDACLAAMGVGMAVKMIGVGVNVMVAATGSGGSAVELAAIAPVQLAVFVGVDVVMGCVFVRTAGRLGLGAKEALTLWVVALNGIFAGVFGALVWGANN